MRDIIRIMHVVENLDLGGMENGIVNLANRFDYARFDFAICCFSHRGALANRLRVGRAKLVELGYGPGTHLESVFHLAHLMKQNRTHILHAHGWGARSLLALIGAKLAGVPFCVNGEHGQLHIERRHQLYLQSAMLRVFDDNLSVSHGLKEKIQSRLRANGVAITVIPNGVDTQLFHGGYPIDALRKEFGVHRGDFLIGVIGSLKWQKNQHIAIKALHRIRHLGLKATLLLVGIGPDGKELQQLSRHLGISDNVLFVGGRDDIPQILSLLNVLVLSSIRDFEGMSNITMEAMASRVPVIASDSIGTRELIADLETGLLFDPDRPEDLADKILLLSKKDSLRTSIIKNARELMEREYSLEVMVKRYEDYYENIFRLYVKGSI
jgi:glycosyltransferase involved in cell wall biosynthesis